MHLICSEHDRRFESSECEWVGSCADSGGHVSSSRFGKCWLGSGAAALPRIGIAALGGPNLTKPRTRKGGQGCHRFERSCHRSLEEEPAIVEALGCDAGWPGPSCTTVRLEATNRTGCTPGIEQGQVIAVEPTARRRG